MSDTNTRGADGPGTAETAEATEQQTPAAPSHVWPQRTVWAVFGGLVVTGSVALGVGSPQQPGPGFWPLAAGLMILLPALSIRTPTGDQPTEETFSHHPRRLLTALASTAVFIALFAAFGLVLPALALQLLWLRVLAGMRWWTAALTAVAVTASLTVALVYGLNVPLPSDPIITLLEGTS